MSKLITGFAFILALVLLLSVSAAVCRAEATEPLCNLDEFIVRYNECMDALEYEKYYGVDAKINRSDLVIKSGDVNDTVIFSFSGYDNGFVMLILEKGTTIIKTITEMFATRGPDKHPEMELEFMTVIGYCSGAIDDINDVNAMLYDMGLYDSGAYAQGKTGNYTGDKCSLFYESTTLQGCELLYVYTH